MFNKQTVFFERDDVIGQVDYPFRIGGSNFLRIALEAIAKPMMAVMTFGFIPLALLLFGIHFVPGSWQNAYALIMGGLVIASVPVARSFKTEAIYSREKETFEQCSCLLGRKFRHWSWPKNLFAGISYGSKGLTRGSTSVVRLRCSIDGYLVDSFFYARHKQEAEAMARRLAEFSGLQVIGEEYTGTQHNLNDLRHHPWLTAKYGKARQ